MSFYLWDLNCKFKNIEHTSNLVGANMYFIEFIIKKLTQKKEKTYDKPVLSNTISDEENCEHVFMPIDSTNETLSCSKCGIIVKKGNLKFKNFFENKNFLD